MIKVHPIAEIFPMMTGEAFDELVKSIKEHKQQEPIVFWRDQLIDGRNRLAACEALGIEAIDCELEDDVDPIAYAIKANIHRRHLTKSQKALMGAKAREMYDEAAKDRQKDGQKSGGRGHTKNLVETLPPSFGTGKARDEVGRSVGVSGKTIDSASKVVANGSKAVVDAVAAGDMTVNQAKKLVVAAPDKTKQTEIVKAGKAAVKAATSTPKVETAKASPKAAPNSKSLVSLPDDPSPADVAEVDAWLERQDERSVFERFKSLWDAADETGRAAIRAFILDE